VRKLLDRAKGILQAERGMTEAEAFRWIQKSSMDRRMTMRAMAEEVLQAAQPAAPSAGGSAAGAAEAAGPEGAGSTPEAPRAAGPEV